MLRLAAVAALGALSAAASAQVMISLARAHDAPAPAVQSAPAAPSAAPIANAQTAIGQDAQVMKGPDGHFWAEASVDGREVKFLVDTGASAVALTPTDAQRLGIDPAGLDYAYTVATASGQAKAAHVRLASVAVAGAQVDNVDAFVIQGGLDHSLLGMSYLGRLNRFEATQTSLILRP
ncbi:MAG TPA: TIGR02281 family clan AA aspartic protease [Caulobacteraceae bacterium]|nr:TIGR02281 family clan AA aspartic protease [Caulobacteraceae bacterium]